MSQEQFVNLAQSTLASGITAGATSLTVASASGFPAAAQFRVTIDSEILLVTAGAGTTTWTVTRGAEGTAAASHSSGATVSCTLTAASLLKGVTDRVGYVANVQTDYGAKGDGSTDDSAAIQSAISAASSGGVVYFPPAAYRLSSGLTVTANVAVHLSGYGATLKPDATVTALSVTQGLGETGIGCTVSGFVIDGQAHATTTGLQIKDTDAVRVRDLHVTGCTTGVHFNVSNATSTWAERSTLLDVLIVECTTGILFERTGGIGLGSFDETVLCNVGVSGCTTGISVGANTEMHRVQFLGVTVWVPASGTGVSLAGGEWDGSNVHLYFEALSASGTTGISIGSGVTNAEYASWQFSWANTFATYLSNATPVRFPYGNGAPPQNFIGARVFHSAGQSIPNNTRTAVAFDSNRYQSRTDFHNTVTNNSRITVPALCGGYYRITFNGQFASNATGQRNFELRVNGTTLIAVMQYPLNSGTTQTVGTISCDYLLNDGDYVEATVYQNSGGALSLDNGANYSPEFSVSRIGN